MIKIDNNQRDGLPFIMSETKTKAGVNIQIITDESIQMGDTLESGGGLFKAEKMNQSRPAKGVYPGEVPTFYDIDLVRIGSVKYSVVNEQRVRTEVLDAV